MFQTFISRHNSNFFSDKLVLTSVTPASSAPVLQTTKATSSTLYFDSLTVNAGNRGLLSCPTRRSSDLSAASRRSNDGSSGRPDPDGRASACSRGRSPIRIDRKSIRLNSSHSSISYAVLCLKNKQIKLQPQRNILIVVRSMLVIVDILIA